MSETTVPAAATPRRTFMGVLLAGAGALLALPSVVGRRAIGAAQVKAGKKTHVRPHPEAVARTSPKAYPHD